MLMSDIWYMYNGVPASSLLLPRTLIVRSPLRLSAITLFFPFTFVLNLLS
jgi:hypothetical protein